MTPEARSVARELQRNSRNRPVAAAYALNYRIAMEKLGLYAPAIAPLFSALAVGLSLQGHHGSGLIIRTVFLVGCLVFAAAMFRRIRRENQLAAD